MTVRAVWPGQLRLTVEAVGPSLNSSSCSSRRGVTKVNDALVGPAVMKLIEVVVSRCDGAARSHALLPQLTTPLGY